MALPWGRDGGLSALNPAVAVGLAVLLAISGLYAIPYATIPADWIVNTKRIYYLAIMAMLAVMAAVGRSGSIDRRFSILCGVLALVFAGNALVRQDVPGEYLYCVLSIAFLWLFVRQVADNRFPLDFFMDNLRVGVVVINLLAVFVLLRCLLGDREMHGLVASGFAGNRVNFSIWLWQVVFLNFFLVGRQRRGFFLALAAASVVLTLQVFSGGRIGALASLAVMIYFAVRRLDGAGVRLAVTGYLLFLVWVAAEHSPIGIPEQTSVFRELGGLQWHGSFLEYVDRVSGHRLRIMINAVGALDLQALLVGRGAGHFDVVADNHSWMVHNVFLKMLGEFGIGACLLLMALVWLPFSGRYRRRYHGRGLHFMLLVGIGVSLLQPRFIVTGLSNCLVMWLCYALILKGECAESLLEPKADRDFSLEMV